MQRITSPHNPRLREAARLLASARDRRKAGKCVLEGEHLVTVYAERHGAPEALVVSEAVLARPQVERLLERFAAASIVVPVALFGELATLPPGVGLVAVVPTPQPRVDGRRDFCLLVEDVQDPGNVGSILRSAAAAGVDRVLLSKQSAFAWSPKVLRAGQGAHFHVDIEEDVDLPSWSRDFASAGGTVVATAADAAVPLYAAALTGRIALVIGNEGSGISPALRAQAAQSVAIPMPGGMESLNVAAAAAVCLYECVRQRAAGRGQ